MSATVTKPRSWYDIVVDGGDGQNGRVRSTFGPYIYAHKTLNGAREIMSVIYLDKNASDPTKPFRRSFGRAPWVDFEVVNFTVSAPVINMAAFTQPATYAVYTIMSTDANYLNCYYSPNGALASISLASINPGGGNVYLNVFDNNGTPIWLLGIGNYIYNLSTPDLGAGPVLQVEPVVSDFDGGSAGSLVYSFNPTYIPGLQVWLDGADPTGLGGTLTNGTVVDTWVDKSGHNNNATGSGSPTFQNSSIYFNGLRYYTLPYAGGSSAETVFIVFRYMNLSTTILCGKSDQSRQISINSTANVDIKLYNNKTSASGVQVYDNAFNILTSSYSAEPTITSFRNGGVDAQLSGSYTPFAASSEGTVLGATGGLADFFSGYISEVLIFNTCLTTAQRQLVEGYLAWKWSLVSKMPTGHSFKTVEPVAADAIFQPTQLPALKLWLDASDISGNGFNYTDGTAVGGWIDKSGLGKSTTATAGTASFQTESIGTRGSIYIDGTASFSGSIDISGNNNTVFFVGIVSSSNVRRYISLGRPGVTDYTDPTSWMALIGGYGDNTIRTDVVHGSRSIEIPCTFNTPVLVSIQSSPTELYISINGNMLTSNLSENAFNITSYGLGCEAAGAGSDNGTIGNMAVPPEVEVTLPTA
jgi:hypothetical protein